MKKTQIILIAITAAYICTLLGVFVGRNMSNKLTLHAGSSAVPESASQHSGKLNINTASVSQLQILPGVGEVLAQSIVDYRNENGPFPSTEALLNVDGIGAKRLEEILDYITIGG